MDLRTIQAGGGGLGGTVARAGLTLLSGGWALAQSVKSGAYGVGLRRARRLPVPVISVGNLAVGGTGKTPFVAWLVQRLRVRGRVPGVLARGYGPPVPGGLSDEGAVLEHLLGPGLPQVEDPDRLRGGRRLLREHPEVDVLVLDDGFQHRRLHRDLDVVLVDARNPLGFGRLLPRGLLRERPAALARAGVVVLTRVERAEADEVERARTALARWTRAPLVRARTEPLSVETGSGREPAGALAGLDVFAVSGLGDPSAFEDTLTRLGARVVGRRRLPDHGTLSDRGWQEVLGEAQRAAARFVVVTRKDAVKYPRADGRFRVLDVATRLVQGEEALDAALDTVLASATTDAPARG
jgi:tetraacyldisaccharide 4'-kinase